MNEQSADRPIRYRCASQRVKRRRTLTPNIGGRSPSIGATRHTLALALVVLVGLIAVCAVISPTGMTVFEKLLPVLTFVLGYFFRQH